MNNPDDQVTKVCARCRVLRVHESAFAPECMTCQAINTRRPPTKLIVFDLDGTLALLDHRKHHIAGQSPDWRAFFAACGDDLANVPVVTALHAMWNWSMGRGIDVWIVSGRSDEVRSQTVDWLDERHMPYDMLLMRRQGDHRPDEVLKEEWAIEHNFKERCMFVFDDRAKVVAMWRRLGIPCFQVAPGEF